MADRKMVEQVTSMDEDFAKWYTDVVKKAELMDYSSVKGCMIFLPAGYALWENIQRILDKRFKATGVENVYMPLFIPESLLQKEKDHVEGFAPEVAWVTEGGGERLEERICVRPTSETLFCDLYKNLIHSYRDLPRIYNQWCSVVRWEKTTRPFLRSREFLWQEGHTIHETLEEAEERTKLMLNVYADFLKEDLAIPTIKGRKTEKERFAGAISTYTIEAMMHDGKALQSGTSHNFGDGFAKAYEIEYTGRDNKQHNPFQTSWGLSTRLIGALIMVHGDNDGLVLPPHIAPTQVVIVPIQQQKEGVLDTCERVAKESLAGIRVKIDDSERSPGFKFAEQEMRGFPLRIEIGPRDIANGECVVVRRDTHEKETVKLDMLKDFIPELLEKIQGDMYDRAKKHLESSIYEATEYEEFKRILDEKPGFVRAMWCGEQDCEDTIKADTTATSRCMPFEGSEPISDKCVCCGKPAKHLVIWGKAY
ncbi:MAG: proline--tRNA ligase [Lachnospiraceae bacterium]|nr:proline--tRNA ligase [Lachnospiraceae bacterium]